MTEQPESTAEQIGIDASVDAVGDDGNPGESYHGYSVDDEDQPQSTGDSMVDDDRGLEEPLDEGFSPVEKYSAGQRFGNTPLEEELGETLDMRVDQEVPEPDPYEEAERASLDEIEGTDGDDQVGTERAGRLVEPDQGGTVDSEGDLVAQDVGIDGAAAGAEEAAVHVVDEE